MPLYVHPVVVFIVVVAVVVGQTLLVQRTVPFIQLHLLHPSEDLNVELLGCLAPAYMQPIVIDS
jgi:hypothetical protein